MPICNFAFHFPSVYEYLAENKTTTTTKTTIGSTIHHFFLQVSKREQTFQIQFALFRKSLMGQINVNTTAKHINTRTFDWLEYSSFSHTKFHMFRLIYYFFITYNHVIISSCDATNYHCEPLR